MAKGHENIKPNAQRTPEELREMGSKGGKASAEARKRRKLTHNKIKMLLEAVPKMSRTQQKVLEDIGLDLGDGEPLTAEHIMLAKIMKKAMDGDENSAAFLYNYGLIPNMRAQLERERIKAMKAAKQLPVGRDDPLVELLSRIDAEAAEGAAP